MLCRRFTFPLLLALGAIACNVLDVVSPPPKEPARLTLYPRSPLDPIAPFAVLPVTVRVDRPGGGAAMGVPVAFELADSAAALGVRFASNAADSGRVRLEDTTSADGTATASVRLGFRSGRTVVRFSALTYGLHDSTTFIMPAGIVRVALSPRDTALKPGSRFALRIQTTAFTDAVFTTSAPDRVTVTPDGVVSALAVGRALIAIGGQYPLPDTVGVSVVPSATFGAVSETQLVLFESDGSGVRSLGPLDSWGLGDLRWAPSGDRLVSRFAPSNLIRSRLYVTDLAGNAARVLGSDTLYEESQPSYSADGQWVWFAGRPGPAESTEIWRVHPDGTAPERLGPPATDGSDAGPSPSPDGGRIAFVTTRGVPAGEKIRILDVATHAVTALDVPGSAARWSPTAELIAYVDGGAIKLMAPDGTGRRTLADSGNPYQPWLDWSPDGQWLVTKHVNAAGLNLIELVRVATGETLPLPYSHGLAWPTWKP
jgi:hypothetical protein